MKFGQVIFRRIIKIVATKCQILRLKCSKIHSGDFGWGSAPEPDGGAYSTPPDPLAGKNYFMLYWLYAIQSCLSTTFHNHAIKLVVKCRVAISLFMLGHGTVTVDAHVLE